MVWSTIVIILVVAVFLYTFVIPIAKEHATKEGFQYSTEPSVNASMANYVGERNRMKQYGNQMYNNLGSSLDPILPTFPMATPAGNKLNNPNISDAEYISLYNSITRNANKTIASALHSPDLAPKPTRIGTNMGLKGDSVKEQLPALNDTILDAKHCEKVLKGRASCSALSNPANSKCGVCLDAGTTYEGKRPGEYIGGLLLVPQDRNAAIDAAHGGTPNYTPTLGKCPPGMFYADAETCTRAANRLNCKEIGDSGGFTGGKTHEGKTLGTVNCAQAPVAGTDVFVYQPKKDKAPYNTVLRIITPFGTGITKVIVTHKGRTYTANNAGKPGQEFTLTIRNVMEADDVDVLVAQEVPHRPKGQVEVFNVYELGRDGNPKTYTTEKGAEVCSRIGTTIASSAQVAAELNNGIQSGLCSVVGDKADKGYFAVQTGNKVTSRTSVTVGNRPLDKSTREAERVEDTNNSLFANSIPLPVGSNPATGFCEGGGDSINYTDSLINFDLRRLNVGHYPTSIGHNWGPNKGVWCYGFKPAAQVSRTDNLLKLAIGNWFDSFNTNAQPAQGPSMYSKYSTPTVIDPPGVSERAITMQWEMEGSTNRTIGFQQTIQKVNDYPVSNVLRLLGPFQNSSLITGPAWSSSSTMLRSLFWFWSNMPRSQSVTFSAKIPGYLHDPYYRDDLAIAPNGPLIANSKTATLLQTSACDAPGQAPGAYSTACLLELFKGSGGDPSKGTFATTGGGLQQLNKLGDVSAIMSHLNAQYVAATSGRDANGQPLSYDINTRMDAMNSAAMQMFGFKIINPCEMIVDNPDGSVGVVPMPMNQVGPECLQYLWLNNNSDQDRPGGMAPENTLYAKTYTSIADRFSGLRNNESTFKLRRKYPFQACQLTGSGAPIKNGKPDNAVISKLIQMHSLQDVQNYMNSIHKAANYSKGPQDAQAQASAIDMCYGVNQAKSDYPGAGCPVPSTDATATAPSISTTA
jgi:hypothetical protein